MERIEEEATKMKRSNRWIWPLAALVVVFLAVAATSRIGFLFNGPISFSYMQQESAKYKGSQKHEKLKVPVPIKLWRERPPSSYSIKFESCKALIDLVEDGYYESRPFTAGGLNWTFLIYPKGINKVILNPYVSLYARIDNSSITDPKDVYAEIKFFVYNHFYKLYYYYGESEPVMLHSFKPEWGVDSYLETKFLTSQYEAFGYTFEGGKCEFGMDVFVAPPFNNWETFSYDKNVSTDFTWNISDFSTLSPDFNTSDPFSSGGRNWVLKVYPYGYGVGTDNSLSLYLLSETNEKDYVRATLRVLNQIPSNNVEKQVEGWPNAAENGWGFEEFMPLSDLKDGTKGFVVDDVLQVEVEIRALSKTTSK
uniref:Ubiquitin carboxyl-terminal hydrolase 12 n=1 Tax=Noccaea caerulescens TaxID=107243 RepID=A0A1J3F3F3_NOCCA